MVHSQLVLYIMVEAVVYEKIFYRRTAASTDAESVDLTTSDDLQSSERKHDDIVDDEYRNDDDGGVGDDVTMIQECAVYEKMNEMNLDKMGDEVDFGSCFNSAMGRLSSSGSSENDCSKPTCSSSSSLSHINDAVSPTTRDDDAEFAITSKMCYTPPEMRRGSTLELHDDDDDDADDDNDDGDDEDDEDDITDKSDVIGKNSESEPIPIFRPRQSQHLPIPTPMKLTTQEVRTVYTRVVSMSFENPKIPDDGSRRTRKSDNPILRQGGSPPQNNTTVSPLRRQTGPCTTTSPRNVPQVKRATSLDDVHHHHHHHHHQSPAHSVGGKAKSYTEHIKNTRHMRGSRARSCDGHGGSHGTRVRRFYENSLTGSNQGPDSMSLSSMPGSFHHGSQWCSRKRRSCCDLPGFCNSIKGRR